jgi:pimeloyl-ACP methyl ester carboxylesterase
LTLTTPAPRTDSPSPPTAAPPTQHLAVPGGTVAYDDAGTGHPVLCVPSLGDVRAEYRFLRPQLLDAGFRVVTMDLRGHGESGTGFADYSAPAIGQDIIDLARHLAAGPVAVVAASKAGGAAAWAAARAPDLIDRLVLVDPFARAHGGDRLLKTLMNVVLARPWGPAMWTRYFPKFYPSRKPDDFAEYRARLRTNLRERGRMEAVKAMMNDAAAATAAVEASLARVAVPTLVVMGVKDPDFKDPTAEARWIADQVHGRVLLVEGAGHYPHVELPDRVGPEIARFLDAEPGRAA